MPEWHEQPGFWDATASFIFRDQIRAAAAEEAGQIISLLRVEPPARILDMPCGVGRHALELARRGFRVTGIDRTPEFLARAASQAGAEGLPHRPEWVEADMRAFPPETGAASFDAAINVYTSFGYFEDPEDDRRVAANFFRALKPGGRLLLEMIGKEPLARRFTRTEWGQEPDGTIVLQERTVSQDWGWIDSRWLIIRGTERQEIRFGHRLYGAAELKALLGSVGFTDVRAYGSLAGTPYDQEAQRLVVVAQRHADPPPQATPPPA